jgi:hypothetical protein
VAPLKIVIRERLPGRAKPLDKCSQTGLPDDLFSNQKNPDSGEFCRAFDQKTLMYFTAIWNILWTIGILYYRLLHLVFLWYIFSCFGIMRQEKSGNPVRKPRRGKVLDGLNERESE